MNRFLQRAAVLRQSDLERSNDAKHNHLAQEVREDFLNALHGSDDSNAERHRHTIRICPLQFISLQHRLNMRGNCILNSVVYLRTRISATSEFAHVGGRMVLQSGSPSYSFILYILLDF